MRRIRLADIPILKSRILSIRQDGCCALCTKKITILEACLDHNHDTGAVRGVLCRNCNGIEGKIKSLVTRARRGLSHEDFLGQLLKYWIFHKENRTGFLHPKHLTDDEKRVKRNTKARKVRAKKKATENT